MTPTPSAEDLERPPGSSPLALLGDSPLPMAQLAGPEHLVQEANLAFCRLLGMTREQLLGRPVAAALPAGEACRALLDRVARTGVAATLDEQACSRPPEAYWSYVAWPVRGPADRPVDLLLQITDVTPIGQFRQRVTAVNEELLLAVVRQHALTEAAEAELRRRETELQQTVTDRETLLREVHHRVKNNLQMLCDAMYLRLRGLDDPGRRSDLQATYSRIYAVARLYEHLYRGKPGTSVALDEYLGRALGGLDELHEARIVLSFEAGARIELDVDRAIHLGLILTELVFNALKHAFPHEASGHITVRLRQVGDHAELQVRDNGVGVPKDLDVERSASLGLRTVALLARGLRATVRVEHDAGACFTVTFPVTPPQ